MAAYEINNLVIEKGEDFDESFKIYNSDGTVLTLDSSFTGVSKLKKHPNSKTEYPFDLILDNENNEVNISMASTITSTLPSGRCCFDVLLTYGYAEPTTKKYIKGTIIVNDTVSI
jgi:hypothetical protein